MEIANFFTELFSQVFRVLQLNMPYFNIPIWSVWVGIFLITISIKIFLNFVGLTTGAFVSSEVHRWLDSKPYRSKVKNTSIERSKHA